MSNKTVILILLVLVLIIALIIWVNPFKPTVEDVNEESTDTEEVAYVDKITANHFFKDGIHTLDGNITVPTPCHEVSIQSELNENEVTLNFTAESTAEICTQVLVNKFFTVSFEAPEKVSIKATFGGKLVELILIEEGEGSLK